MIFSLNKISAIDELFKFFTVNSIEYVWLHDYSNEELGDVDIAVGKKWNLKKLVRNFTEKNGWVLLQVIQHEYCAKYFVMGKIGADNTIEYLIPDICSDYVRNGRILIKSTNLLMDSTNHTKYHTCAPVIEAEYVFLKRFLKLNWGEKHINNLNALLANYPDLIKQKLSRYLSKKTWESFLTGLNNNDIDKINSIAPVCRKNILRKTLISNPLSWLYYRLLNAVRLLKRILRPTGLTIVILGIDGSGKSSVIKQLTNILNPIFRNTQTYHFKPTFTRGKSSPVVTNPHKDPPRFLFISLIKLMYYLVHFNIGYLIAVSPKKVRSTLVIFDRYYYDLSIDQLRFRMCLPEWVINICYYLIPHPDLVFLIDTDPNTAFKRKGELSPEELAKQRKLFLNLKTKLKKRFYPIDNNGDLDKTVLSITKEIFTFTSQKTCEK